MPPEPDTQPSPEAPIARRRHPRYRFSVPLTIRSTDGEITGAITLEISASGVSAITERSLRLNDTVELEPIAASKVLAVVPRNVGRIYGFEFLALSSEQATQLSNVANCFRGTKANHWVSREVVSKLNNWSSSASLCSAAEPSYNKTSQ